MVDRRQVGGGTLNSINDGLAPMSPVLQVIHANVGCMLEENMVA